MARGNDGQKHFLRESDYQAFLEGLRTVRQRYPFLLYAYVLIEKGDANLFYVWVLLNSNCLLGLPRG
jgi:hypothetical protein